MTTSAQNISGAMFPIRKEVMIALSWLQPRWSVRRRSWLLLLAFRHRLEPRGARKVAARADDLLGELFLGRFLDVLLARVGNHPLEECDPLDELGQRLDDQQEETDRHHEARGPDDESAGVGRHFVP